MRRIVFLLVALVTLAGVVAGMGPSSRRADEEAASISGGKLPPGYRDWRLISVAHEEGDLNDIRAVLGNDVAIKAYREGKPPFPDGTIIARLAWKYVPSEENNKTFGRPQSFVAGPPVNGVQFMVKDSKKYASTGGWGFAHFDDGKPAGEAMLKRCFACHALIKDRDLVFTHYAP
jgi:Cytochrome P460